MGCGKLPHLGFEVLQPARERKCFKADIRNILYPSEWVVPLQDCVHLYLCVSVFVCLGLDAIVSPSLLSNDTSGTGSENGQTHTLTPSFSHTCTNMDTHIYTNTHWGSHRNVVLLETECSPVHGLSMEHWNVRTRECQQEVGVVKQGRVVRKPQELEWPQWDYCVNLCM